MGSSRKNLAPEVTTKVPPARLRRTPRRRVGEPMVWLSGGATALGVVMIIALVGMIFAKGLATFWPQEVEVFVLGAENKDDDTLGTHLTPYQLADEQGKLVPSASALSSEASKNHKLLLGVLWKSQDLNPSLLPLNSKTRAPWGAHEIDAESLTIRIGNAGEALAPNPAIVGDDARYTKELVEGKSFVNIKANIPELDVYRESSPSGYAETVLHRQVADKWVATIDRQIDSSAYGYVVGVYDGATPLATVEKDGLERVWEVFQEHLNEAQHFLDLRREYEEERGEEIASVTNTLEDRILDLRYRHRNTPEIVTLAGRLNYLFDAWKRDQPTMGSLRFDDASFLQALSLWLPKAASAINADKALPPPPLRGELRFFDTNAWKNELSTARSEINQSEALSDLRDWVLEKAPALQSLSEDPSVDELQQVLGLASDAALMTESWLETYANTTISANDPRFAQPQALESALDEWFWPAGISGRPEIKRLPDSDIEDTLDTISKAFPSTPEALSHGTSFRHIYAQAWQEFVSTTKETKNERILTEHESDLKGLLDAYARKAVLQAILQVPTDSEILRLGKDETRFTYVLQSYEGKRAFFNLSHVVRAFRPNDLSLFGKAGVFVDRFWEFVAGKDRLRNEVEGSITKVIFGTLLMTMMMAVVVVPFGVITALYLREYAKQGPLVSIVRIAVNNLAGVPSIVFGIFGFGFFSIVVGGQIDDWLYPHRLPNPTYGGGGILWASLTLALLTVPVVIVATEEALASVPSAQREASLGCGASRFQTIIRVILPQATPGILTGTILAMARGAGEVAPLMLVGVVPSTEDFPIDGFAPFFHLERKFEHLGFHIFDLSFQYKEPDYARPFVFSSALLLLAVVASLNIFAIRLRNRLRRKFKTSHV